MKTILQIFVAFLFGLFVFAQVPAVADQGGATNETASKSANPDVERVLEIMDQVTALSEKKKEEQKALLLQALQLAEKATKEFPKNAKAWWVRGNVFYCLNRKQEAEESIRKSIELDPKAASAHSSLGQILAEDGKNEDAVDAWKKAVEVDPTYVNAWANIGQCYQLQGKKKESLECWRKVVVLDDLDWRAWSKIIQCTDSKEEAEKARTKLFSLHNEGKIKTRRFCREQFSVGAKKVMAFEYFVPEGWEHVRYEFYVLGKSDTEPPQYRYVLGEIDGDTELARSQKTIGPDEHMFCIDGFHPAGRQTLVAMIKGKDTPTYDSVRKLICEHITKSGESQ